MDRVKINNNKRVKLKKKKKRLLSPFSVGEFLPKARHSINDIASLLRLDIYTVNSWRKESRHYLGYLRTDLMPGEDPFYINKKTSEIYINQLDLLVFLNTNFPGMDLFFMQRYRTRCAKFGLVIKQGRLVKEKT